MRLVEDPFITRQSIVATLKLGEPSTEAPFKTLRAHDSASSGWSVALRRRDGHVAGRLHLYCSLNHDAARLFRRGQRDHAKRLAAAANEIEASASARTIRDAIAEAVTHAVEDRRWVDAWTTYSRIRRSRSWLSLDSQAMFREWLASPGAWLAQDDDSVRGAVAAVSRQVEEVRAQQDEAYGEAVTTFLGVVRRMDATAAELQGESGEQLLVMRRDLEREGLSVVGVAVAVVREELPTGRVVVFVAPAADLGTDKDEGGSENPFDPADLSILTTADSRWMERALASDPKLLSATPLALTETS